MSTQYRLVQSGKTASGGCSAGQGSSEPVAPRIIIIIITVWAEIKDKGIPLHNKVEKHKTSKVTLKDVEGNNQCYCMSYRYA
jgi:hypothetical protein